jgi:hypothetical protein
MRHGEVLCQLGLIDWQGPVLEPATLWCGFYEMLKGDHKSLSEPRLSSRSGLFRAIYTTKLS